MDTIPSSPPSVSSPTTKYEFEGIEVVEFDANALWELLQDEPKEEEAAAPEEAIELNPNSVIESYWSLKENDNNNNNNNDNDMVQDFDWFRIMEEGSIPCSEMEEMSQILEIRDYSFSHTPIPILSDEIGYIGLWHE